MKDHIRMAGDLLKALALAGTGYVPKQLHRGKLTYDNPQELFNSAVIALQAEGRPVTPQNIRAEAMEQVERMQTMIEDVEGV